jgi:hypothetical protein
LETADVRTEGSFHRLGPGPLGRGRPGGLTPRHTIIPRSQPERILPSPARVGQLLMAISLVYGLELGEERDRALFSPPGYPLADEYTPCNNPHGIDEAMWVWCVLTQDW